MSRKPLEKLTYITDGKRHLICLPFSIANLHRTAFDLGIGRHWFHNNKRFPHYDIPVNRLQLVESKCLKVTSKEIINIIKQSQNVNPSKI